MLLIIYLLSTYIYSIYSQRSYIAHDTNIAHTAASKLCNAVWVTAITFAAAW